MPDTPTPRWTPDGGITIYGRKPALEALLDPTLKIHCLHLATSNRPAKIIAQITEIANKRRIEIRHHDRLGLSRISKNSKQDQGVALDIICNDFCSITDFLASPIERVTLLALDGVTNPQNVGMIIRSAVAAGVDGLLYPAKGGSGFGAACHQGISGDGVSRTDYSLRRTRSCTAATQAGRLWHRNVGSRRHPIAVRLPTLRTHSFCFWKRERWSQPAHAGTDRHPREYSYAKWRGITQCGGHCGPCCLSSVIDEELMRVIVLQERRHRHLSPLTTLAG